MTDRSIWTGASAVAELPSEDEYLGFFDTLSNWGRWGDDDRLGTFNLIGHAQRLAASKLVQEGAVVSLSRDMDPLVPDPLGRGTVIQRFMQVLEPTEPTQRFEAIREYVGLIAHGSNTHLDGLGHVTWQGKSYNGFEASDVSTVRGSTKLSVHDASDGVVTRGVLLDIPRTEGQPWLQPGRLVGVDDLEAAERLQGVRVAEGDVLLLHTGNFRRILTEGLHPELHSPGFGADCLPWLHERGVAMIASDNLNDAVPSGYLKPDLRNPVHCVALVAMGLWMVDNIELDELATACAARERWEFFFAMLPWRLKGVTASPVNPIAMF